MNARERAVSALYGGAWKVSVRTPPSVAGPVFRLGADAAFARRGRGVRQLRRNLARVRPELSASDLDTLTREAMRSYLRYWQEVFQLPAWSAEEVRGRITASHLDRLAKANADGQGVVVVLGHFGNWDHAGAWITKEGFRLVTVAERLRPERVFRQFVAYRESLGMEVLPLTGDRELSTTLLRRLDEGAMVALLADRDLTGHGISIDLMGEAARLPVGPAMLASRADVPLIPVLSWYEERQNHIFFAEALQSSHSRLRDRVYDLTQQWANVVAETARAHSSDWHMLQPVWVSDLQRTAPPPREAVP